MTPTEQATYYRENAAECLLIAKRILSASERLALIDIAQAWTTLAHHAENNPQLSSVGKDLEPEHERYEVADAAGRPHNGTAEA